MMPWHPRGPGWAPRERAEGAEVGNCSGKGPQLAMPIAINDVLQQPLVGFC